MSELLDQVVFTSSELMASMPYFVVSLVILLVAKLIYDKTTSFCFNEHLTEKDNPAVGIVLTGYLIGVGIALTGVIKASQGLPMQEGLLNVGISGFFAIVFIRLSIIINDKLILSKFDIYKELLTDKNTGTAFVIAGSCIATGLMMTGVLTGSSVDLVTAVRDTVIYWVAGQAILVLGSKAFSVTCRYDIHECIEKDDNVAAGISFGGFLIALGIIAFGCLNGATSNIKAELTLIVISGLFGIIMLISSSIICDKLILPKSLLAKEISVDKNIAAGAVSLAVFISVSVALSSIINSSI